MIGQFLEMVDNNTGIVGSTTGSNYYVRILSTLNRQGCGWACWDKGPCSWGRAGGSELAEGGLVQGGWAAARAAMLV